MSPHHYPHLVKRWKALARRAGLRLLPFAEADGVPLFYMETPALAERDGLYLSAGIHGDEPAGTEGLLAWAEKNAARLRTLPLLIFPCLNPWGLTHNTRTDSAGLDLNRNFHRRHPVVTAVRRIVGKRRFAASVNLHEDYDAEGLYLYEVTRSSGCGEKLIAAASRALPHDPRKRIEGRGARNGLIRRHVTAKTFAKIGVPEAIWLYFEHTEHAFTIETPSEFALERRVAAHVAALDAVAREKLRGV
jgi:hypothetical protein